MKNEKRDWMDWLHDMRREGEAKRIREGVSMTEWLRRVRAEAEEIRSHKHEQPAVRDRPAESD